MSFLRRRQVDCLFGGIRLFLRDAKDVAQRRERNEWQSGGLSERQVANGNFCDTNRSRPSPTRNFYLFRRGELCSPVFTNDTPLFSDDS